MRPRCPRNPLRLLLHQDVVCLLRLTRYLESAFESAASASSAIPALLESACYRPFTYLFIHKSGCNSQAQKPSAKPKGTVRDSTTPRTHSQTRCGSSCCDGRLLRAETSSIGELPVVALCAPVTVTRPVFRLSLRSSQLAVSTRFGAHPSVHPRSPEADGFVVPPFPSRGDSFFWADIPGRS